MSLRPAQNSCTAFRPVKVLRNELLCWVCLSLGKRRSVEGFCVVCSCVVCFLCRVGLRFEYGDMGIRGFQSSRSLSCRVRQHMVVVTTTLARLLRPTGFSKHIALHGGLAAANRAPFNDFNWHSIAIWKRLAHIPCYKSFAALSPSCLQVEHTEEL
jgi:hypothetical protein